MAWILLLPPPLPQMILMHINLKRTAAKLVREVSLVFFNSDTPLAATSARSQKITSAIAYFICKDNQPYSVVENEGFRQLLHILDPTYKIPVRGTFTDTHIPALYNKVRREIVESLSNAQRVAITVDGWTSCAIQSYIIVTAHYIDDEWSMKTPVLQTRAFNEEHKGENLAALLRDVCCEWKIEGKKPALVTDNASNMLLAGTLAEMKPHVRCIAHTLNLSSQKALQVDTVSALLVKMRRIVTYFHKSPKACEALHEIQTQLHLKHHKPVHDVSTMWNSSLEMMERFWEQQPAVTLSLTTRRVKTKGLPSITDEELTLLPEIIKLMTPLKVATECLSGEKTPTISIIAPTLAKLREDFEPNDSDLQVIFEMKEKFRQDFDTRYTYIQDLLNKASALDPRFKELEFLDDNNSRDTIFLRITAEVEEMI
uniref:Zinc finger BED domain-containing protein 1 n=1 Tax=Dicentrarchus labrax TaxID=13489 RepID=A0A8C4GH43_DICLA